MTPTCPDCEREDCPAALMRRHGIEPLIAEGPCLRLAYARVTRERNEARRVGLERYEAMRAERDRAEAALVWALGASRDHFPERGDGGPYWWRTELRQRAGLSWDGSKYVRKAGGAT